mgnify:CR=1 FL=1
MRGGERRHNTRAGDRFSGRGNTPSVLDPAPGSDYFPYCLDRRIFLAPTLRNFCTSVWKGRSGVRTLPVHAPGRFFRGRGSHGWPRNVYGFPLAVFLERGDRARSSMRGCVFNRRTGRKDSQPDARFRFGTRVSVRPRDLDLMPGNSPRWVTTASLGGT